MIFNKDTKFNTYVEILENDHLNVVIEEYKEFIKLTDVIDFFIKRLVFTFARISKEIKNYYAKDEKFKHLEKSTYNICRRAYFRLENLDSLLKNRSYEYLIESYKNYVISTVPDLSTKAAMIKDIKRLHNVYFDCHGKFRELIDKIFRGKAICLACLETFGFKISKTEEPYMHAIVVDYFYKREALKNNNSLAKDFYLLELFSFCSGLN